MEEPQRIKETIEKKKVTLEKDDGEIKDAGTLVRRGGYRPGSGRKKGQTDLVTRTKKEAKDRFITRVQANVDNLFNAQLALATGEQHLFVKYHTGEGKDRRAHVDIVTDPDTIAQYLTDNGYSLNQENDDEYFYIATKPANNQAIDSLLNRAFGKAPEKIEVEGGFFKASNLKIEIVNPEIIDIEEAEVIDGTNTDTTNESDETPTEYETEPSS